MMADTHLSVEFLGECFRYEPTTGRFYWKHRPRSHFRSVTAWKSFNNKRAGTECLQTPGKDGYHKTVLTADGRRYDIYAHRLAWTLMTGAHPEDEVDHHDGDRSNHTWDNLREATRIQNSWNRGVSKNNKLGIKGVCEYRGKFRSSIKFRGVYYHLGDFLTLEEASSAHQDFARNAQKEFFRDA